ncbi:hypothetical protein HDU99_006701, partial [Rhizoclosmatium hyalinum]
MADPVAPKQKRRTTTTANGNSPIPATKPKSDADLVDDNGKKKVTKQDDSNDDIWALVAFLAVFIVFILGLSYGV